MNKSRLLIYSAPIVAIIACSWAAIFIRWADDASPLVIAFYRMLIASIFWVPLFWVGHSKSSAKPKKLSSKQLKLMVVSGIFLALHFAFWITSLRYTSISSSVFLILTQPIMVAIAAHFFLSERLNRWNLLALLATLIGALLIIGGDINLSSDHLKGDLLALIGAASVGVYFIIARIVRPDKEDEPGVELFRYLPIVYTTATLTLFVICLIFGESFGPFAKQTWWALIALGIVPTIIGHSLFNWSLKYLPSLPVNIALVGEPIGASVLAFILLSEYPSKGLLIGSIFMVLAVVLVFVKPPKKENPI